MEYVRYTNALDVLYNSLDGLIHGSKLKNKKIIMFGTNKIAGMIIYYLEKNGISVSSIIDNNKMTQGQTVFGKAVYSPEDLLSEFCDIAVILIASGYQDEMIEQLENMNYVEGIHILKVIDLPQLMEDYSFIDRTGYKELTDTQLRDSQIRCMKKVKEICEKNGLRYFLSGGTLLGAVRHQGYIPWDDDVDVFIVLKDWERFCELVKSEPLFGFVSFIGEDDYYDEMGLFYDKTTICDYNHFPMQTTAGVSIDIVPLIGLPDTEEEIRDYARRLKEQYSVAQNILYSADECRKECHKLYKMMLEYDYDTAKNVGHLLGPYFMKEVRPKEWFSRPVYLKFEDDEYIAPNGYDGYLSKLYGNYMELPPENKRKGHHFFKAYSCHANELED